VLGLGLASGLVVALALVLHDMYGRSQEFLSRGPNLNRTRQSSCRSANPARSKIISFDFAQFNDKLFSLAQA